MMGVAFVTAAMIAWAVIAVMVGRSDWRKRRRQRLLVLRVLQQRAFYEDVRSVIVRFDELGAAMREAQRGMEATTTAWGAK